MLPDRCRRVHTPRWHDSRSALDLHEQLRELHIGLAALGLFVLLVQPVRQIDAHEVGASRERGADGDLDAAIGSTELAVTDTGPDAGANPNEMLDEVFHRVSSPFFNLRRVSRNQ